MHMKMFYLLTLAHKLFCVLRNIIIIIIYKFKHEEAEDMTSMLPDHILELILSHLPINQVVRTSVLSKRWRYLWKSIPYFPSLHIDYSTRSKNFKKFVDLALANKTNLDLLTFSLYYLSYKDLETAGQWIQAATVMRKVKSLDLRIRSISDPVRLPPCMVNCDSLESLRLVMDGNKLSLPDSARFPALPVLKLNNIYFFGHNLKEGVLKSCPLIEDFSLINCFIGNFNPRISCPKLKTLRIHNLTYLKDSRLVVSCPKLVALEYIRSHRANLFVENLDSLKKAVILPKYVHWPYSFSSQLGNDICKFLTAISHVESLSLSLFYIQPISKAPTPEKRLWASLPRLKTLELTTTVDAFIMKTIIRIISCSPNLKSLRLIIQQEHLRSKYWKLDEVKTRRILTRHLKRVEFLDFNGEEEKLGIVRLLLEHGKALEEMVFSWPDEVKYIKKSVKMMNHVSKFHQASSTVKVIARLKEIRQAFC